MQETVISLLVGAALIGAALGSAALYNRVPERHRRAEAEEIVRLIANIFVVLASLALGLMTNSARTAFDSYLAVGCTALIGVPAVFNVCVATGLLPTKGLPLPLISSGGSNLVIALTALGLLLRVDREGARA